MAVTLMMSVREVGMYMNHRLMPMVVGMLHSRRHSPAMDMLMMRVVGMFMAMFQRIMSMLMFVMLGQM